jgi:TPR repeat protein
VEQAAEAIYRRALQLASSYRERNVTRILALLEEAATFDHTDACFELANWRHFGIGATRDDVAAVRLWERAAERGHTQACMNLAIACERGIGTARDTKRAFTLYDACARSGDVNALYEAGRCRYYGIGTDIDRDGAEVCFLRARQFGHAEATCDAAESDGPRRIPRPAFAGPFRAIAPSG